MPDQIQQIDLARRQLDRYLDVDRVVISNGKVDHAHPPTTQFPLDPIGAKSLTESKLDGGGDPTQQTGPEQAAQLQLDAAVVAPQKSLQFSCQSRVFIDQLGHPFEAFLWCHLH